MIDADALRAIHAAIDDQPLGIKETPCLTT